MVSPPAKNLWIFLMGRVDYSEAFRVQKTLMTLSGIWPRQDLGLWYQAHGFVSSLLLQLFFIAPSMLQAFSASTDAAHGSYIMFCTLTIWFYIIKLIIFYANRHSFYEILADLEQPLFKSHLSQFDPHIKKAVNASVTIRKLIQFSCVLLIAFMATYPALDPGSSQRPLPFELPLNTERMSFFLYAAVYCVQIVAAAICACNNLNMDTLAFSFISLGSAQLEILVESLKASVSVAPDDSGGGGLGNYGRFDVAVMRTVKRCARHHVAISKYVGKLEKAFTYLFLAQFVDSLVVICITGFSFFVIPVSNVLFWTCLSYFTAAMLEIGMYCLSGDELIIQSLKVRDACYMSQWTGCGPEVRKILFIIMERSKKPFVLTAGKFANLSRDSLVTICKSSFSYLTVLRKMYGTNK